MRISDWSSDVCSSDLVHLALARRRLRCAGTCPGSETACQRTKRLTVPERRHTPPPGHPGLAARRSMVQPPHRQRDRSEERRVGKEWVSTCRSRWSPTNNTKKHQTECSDMKHDRSPVEVKT